MKKQTGKPVPANNLTVNAEEALRQSEDNFHTFFDSMGDMIIVGTPEGKILHSNPAMSLKLGYSPDELKNMHVLDVHPAEKRAEAETIFAAMFKGERETCPLPLQRKDGTYLPVETRVWLGKWSGQDCIFGLCKDLSREQEALQKFDRFFNSNPTPMAVNAIPGQEFTEINTAWLKLLGYSREEVLGRTSGELGLFLQPERQMEIVNQLSKVGHISNEELLVRRKDGSIIHGLFSGDIIESQGRQYLLTAMVDLTDRMKTEDALRQSEAQYRLLADHMTETIWLADMNLKTIYQSPSMEKLLGYTRQEFAEMALDQMITPVSLDRATRAFLEDMEKLKADPNYNQVRALDIEYRRKDGTTLWTENKFSIIRDENGKAVSILGESRDISERKKAQESLNEEHLRLQGIIEGTNAGTWEWNVQTGETVFNERWAQILGYTLDELAPVSIKTWEELAHPDDLKLSGELLERHFKGDLSYYDCECRMKHKDGHWVWVLDRGRVISRTAEGKPLMMFGTHIDMTERKQYEEEKQRVEKLESVGLLAAGIAHDFNNILTTILGNISLARMETVPGSEMSNSLEQAEKASLRAKDLTVQLLTFSKGGAPVKKLTSLNELIRETALFTLRGSNVMCQFSIPVGLWPAEIDQGQVGQVIRNLVINARQAMPDGGEINISAENMPPANMRSLVKGLPVKLGDYVRIAVIDHGSGIPEENLEKVFDPFFTTRPKSSGLGLATAFSIARQHGGHLCVASELGSGSTFYLYLPAHASAAGQNPGDKGSAGAAGTARILLMDDDQRIREITGRMLRHLGYQDVEYAADGAEAIKLYKKAVESGKPYGIVILDLTVAGGMGGEAAMRQLLKIDPGVRAVVSSGYIDDPVISDYRRYGFSGTVVKPYTLEELSKALQHVVGR